MEKKRNTIRKIPFVILLFLLGLFAGRLIFGLHEPTPAVSKHEAGLDKSGSAKDTPPGRWRKIDKTADRPAPEIDRALGSLPYLDGYHPAPAKKAVTVHDRGRAHRGLNFCVSAHGPEAFIMDMEGNELHRWRKSMAELWPNKPNSKNDYWSQALVLENGDLIGLFQYMGLFRLDRDSNPRWLNANRAHHSIVELADGRIMTFTRRANRGRGIIKTEGLISEDFIAIFDGDGRLIEEISLLELIADSDYSPILARMDRSGDVLHANMARPLDGRIEESCPPFKAGRLLISVRNINLVGVADLTERRLVWAQTSIWRRQHDPSITPRGGLLVFDNNGQRGRSRILELLPCSLEVIWSYRDGVHGSLHTDMIGTVQRLPNGNTLIVESERGRALEVGMDRETVWEYVNPHRAGENKELVATLFQMVRLDPDFGGCGDGACFE